MNLRTWRAWRSHARMRLPQRLLLQSARLQDIIETLLINSGVALLLSLLDPAVPFWINWVYANCVGCSIVGLTWVVERLGYQIPRGLIFMLTVPLGMFSGLSLAAWLGLPNLLQSWQFDSLQSWQSLLVSLLLSLLATVFALLRYQSQRHKTQLANEQRIAAQAKQAETQAQLRLLQAQIEPHFLFNTLANVETLIRRDASQAQVMLNHLNHYLRTALQRTRHGHTTVRHEVELITHLLELAKMRLSDRFSYQLDIDNQALELPLPPLLLQPLVENAILHGIEPSMTPCQLTIRINVTPQTLELQVLDDGVGFNTNASSSGIGLANVQQRLFQLYQGRASCQLFAQQPHGCLAIINIPL